MLARERQRLPIDVPQAGQATLGGVVATNSSGPRRYGHGTIRDYVIGISAVDGRGVAVQRRRPGREERRRLRFLQAADRLARDAGRHHASHAQGEAAARSDGAGCLRLPNFSRPSRCWPRWSTRRRRRRRSNFWPAPGMARNESGAGAGREAIRRRSWSASKAPSPRSTGMLEQLAPASGRRHGRRCLGCAADDASHGTLGRS